MAPPIELFNPAFAYFSSKAFNPQCDVPDDFVRQVQNFSARFAVIYASEHDRGNGVRSSLGALLKRPIISIRNSDKTSPDFVTAHSCGELPVYLIIGEEKNEFGDGGSDPSVQAAFSFQRLFSQEEVMISVRRPFSFFAHSFG